MKTLKIFLILLASVLLSGCHESNNKKGEHLKSHSDISADACVASGGVPIHSKFNGSFNECQYPPSE